MVVCVRINKRPIGSPPEKACGSVGFGTFVQVVGLILLSFYRKFYDILHTVEASHLNPSYIHDFYLPSDTVCVADLFSNKIHTYLESPYVYEPMHEVDYMILLNLSRPHSAYQH